MRGILDHSAAREHHSCSPPLIHEFGPRDRDGISTIRPLCPEGTRYHCDCGRTWIVWNRPPTRSAAVYIAGGLRWRPESTRERRARTGDTGPRAALRRIYRRAFPTRDYALGVIVGLTIAAAALTIAWITR